MERWRDIYDYWFGAPESPEHGEVREFWFRGGPEVDREIRERFAEDYARAAMGEYLSWRESKESCLALVVLLDQFPRNIYRGDPRSFAADDRALEVAKHIVTQPWHAQLLPVQRLFAYLPFEHSESLENQKRAVSLFEAMPEHPERQNWIDYAVKHLVIVEQFGRFPHRNSILGRACTPEEQQWLDGNEERFGTAGEPRPAKPPEDAAGGAAKGA